MKTLTVYPSDEKQEKAIKMFLDSLNASYEHEPEVDATEHLMSSPAMVEHLNTSIQQEKEGRLRSFTRSDLWK